jgi:hypothetical protein
LVAQLPSRLAEDGYEVNWLRHGITMASRADQLQEEEADGRTKSLSLLSLAKGTIERLSCLRPDLTELDADPMFTSLAQFDFLFCVVGVGDAESAAGKAFYPSFARCAKKESSRSPNRLLEDPQMRAPYSRLTINCWQWHSRPSGNAQATRVGRMTASKDGRTRQSGNSSTNRPPERIKGSMATLAPPPNHDLPRSSRSST